jgi:hypothetical protein
VNLTRGINQSQSTTPASATRLRSTSPTLPRHSERRGTKKPCKSWPELTNWPPGTHNGTEREHHAALYGVAAVKQFLAAQDWLSMRRNSPRFIPLITAIAAGRLDLGESIEVEIDDRLEGDRGGAVAEAVG